MTKGEKQKALALSACMEGDKFVVPEGTTHVAVTNNKPLNAHFAKQVGDDFFEAVTRPDDDFKWTFNNQRWAFFSIGYLSQGTEHGMRRILKRLVDVVDLLVVPEERCSCLKCRREIFEEASVAQNAAKKVLGVKDVNET